MGATAHTEHCSSAAGLAGGAPRHAASVPKCFPYRRWEAKGDTSPGRFFWAGSNGPYGTQRSRIGRRAPRHLFRSIPRPVDRRPGGNAALSLPPVATPASSPFRPRPPRKPSQGGCRLLLPSVDMGSILGRSPVSLHHLLETEAPLQLHSSPRRSEAHWGGLERRPFRYACVEPFRAVTAGRQTSPGVLRQVEWSSGSGTIRGGGAGRGPLAQPARSAASNATFRMPRPCQLPAAGSQRFQR